MFFRRRRRRRSGLSLTSLLVLGGALYFTGAGGWFTDKIAQLPTACYDSLSGRGQAVCGGVEKVTNGIVSVATTTGNWLNGITGRDGGMSGLPASLPNTPNMGSFGGSSGGMGIDVSRLRMPDWANVNMQSLTSRLGDGLNMQQLQQRGPSISMGSNLSMSDALRGAVERFALGNQYANPGSVNYSPGKAMAWHQQGAQFGDYGFGSQLALGNAYSQGWGGSTDTGRATAYLQQALKSLDSLSGSSDPQAQQYLHSFGASPDAMRKDITNQLNALKNR